jgi:pyrimidine operon attenuation protein/uracil phosphoribosyltransferase
VDKIAVVGVRTRGATLAERIVAKIQELEGRKVPYGVLDITLYRDDFRKRLKQRWCRSPTFRLRSTTSM